MRIAYADPPYIGQAKAHYSDDPRCAEVDHADLIAKLEAFDGWALSASSTSLRAILPLCPEGVRIGAWVKPFAVFHQNPAYAWEPVLFRPARALRKGAGSETVQDWVSANIINSQNAPGGSAVHGQKPMEFCFWLFAILGMRPGDDFEDLFPGSGGVTRRDDRVVNCVDPHDPESVEMWQPMIDRMRDRAESRVVSKRGDGDE